MDKLRVVRRVVGVLFLLTSLALHATPVRSQEATDKPKPKRAVKATSQWRTYVSGRYGFQFRYPSGSSIELEHDTNYDYIRVQNYTPGSGSYALKPSEFYLEVFIIDPALGHRRWEPCDKAIKDPKLIRKGGIVVYTGVDEDPGGDPGGYRRVLCAQLQKCDVRVHGTEGRQETPTVRAILSTFRFSK